jgi:hypothetical protein
VTADARLDAVVELMEPHVVDGRTVGYIAHLADGGYCLCGADDMLLPVYLYRPFGTYDPTNPDYQYLLSTFGKRLGRIEIAMAQRNGELDPYEAELARRAADWNELIAGRIPQAEAMGGDRAAPASMSLPVRSYWHQGSPYNDQCPELTPGADDRCVVGCVATTAAQIMYFWRWPDSGNGSDSVQYTRRYRTDWDFEPLSPDPDLNLSSFWTNRLYWTSAYSGRLYMSGRWDGSIYWSARGKCNGGVDCDNADYHGALETLWDRLTQDPVTCYANFGSTTYNWNSMRDSHTDPPDSGDAEAAELSHHAGIAVGMGYGVLASTAGLTRNGLVDHFRYDSDAAEATRNVNTMVEEIQWYRPVEIAGSEPGVGGHSWIVCGYNQNTTPWQFRMNMGWGGGSTEWHSVDEVFPDNQWNTIRIAPKDVVKFVGGGTRGDGTPNSPYSDLETALGTVVDGTTLVMKAGTTHSLPRTGDYVVLDKPITLMGHMVTIIPQ